ncbi:MAG TPA: hypothetical protein VEX69_06100 [Candidatus Limnocylindria bacterium]|nr:hypothetical protein [Candidatus Limnocylindria bacterium]
MRIQVTTRWFAIGILLFLGGCGGSSPNSSTTNGSSKPDEKKSAEKPGLFAPKPIVIESGTVLDVTLDQSVSSKTNNQGDHFNASLAAPVTAGEKVVLPVGTKVDGEVTLAHSAGRFKGNAALGLALDSITVNGKTYPIQATSVEQSGKGRGKRTAVGAGGGAVLGALVGALAGGGKGAAIGAAAGAGAGTAGAAYTGKRDIDFPAETRLSFKLTQPVSITPK